MAAALCPALFTDGFCLRPACNLQHDTSTFCFICNVALNSAEMFNQHVGGQPHAHAMNASQWLECTLCNRQYVAGTPMQFDHERGRKHVRKLGIHPVNGAPVVIQILAPAGHVRCDACHSTMTSAQFVLHCNTTAHLARQRILDCHNALIRTQSNQRGVEVSGLQDGINFGTLLAVNPAPATLPVTCTRVDPGAVSLTHVRVTSLVGAHPGLEPRFTVAAVGLPTEITPGNNFVVHVHFDPHGHRGRFEDRLELVFQDPDGNVFAITRPLKAAVGNNQDLLKLAPTQRYRRARRAAQHNESTVIKEEEEPHAHLHYLRPLQFEGIPTEVIGILQQESSIEEQIDNFREQFMSEGLNATTFQQYWSKLVHLEHHQAKIELSYFNKDNVRITKVGNLYQLNVPGMAEKRPSVLIGDRIKLHPHSEDEGVWFQGVVRQTDDAAVRLSFHESFPYTPRTRYDVKFTLNPVPFRRMHHALQVTPKRLNLLFPEPNDIPEADPTPAANTANLVLYNNVVGLNDEQFQAVRRIIELPPGSPPFVVFGPPGTGKTVTIVESICQLLNNKNNRVLACAPSNSASDLIALRVINNAGIQPDRLLRLNAIGRLLGEYPDELLPYSCLVGERFSAPILDTLKSYQIIIATCSSAAMLDGLGVDQGHFSHVFVDEAGQGLEPEAMIPILTMAGPKTNVVLSGDPKQLGPVIQSPVARELGLKESYLQRLMNSPAYDVTTTMRGVSVVKLLQNFRSHQSVLAFPNEEFYSNELIASAPAPIANSLLDSGWNGLGAPDFPVIFDAVSGGDEREGTSPSYFNPLEASIVKAYVQSLIPFIASTRNIGIVTPYRGQVRKIKTLLREINITDIDIGSVEQFQGQERQVIIVSTVRSSQELLTFDLRHTLGFVANAQRLNVAITRAQALLIVVGDPQVLGLDALWRRFMYYIHAHGGWRGTPFPWDPNADPDETGAALDVAAQEAMDLLRRAGLQGPHDDSGDSDDTGDLDQGDEGV